VKSPTPAITSIIPGRIRSHLMANGMRAAVAVCASIASLDGPGPREHGFSGHTFLHKNNDLAPERLFLLPRKINRLNRFSRTNPSEIRAYFHGKHADHEVLP